MCRRRCCDSALLLHPLGDQQLVTTKLHRSEQANSPGSQTSKTNTPLPTPACCAGTLHTGGWGRGCMCWPMLRGCGVTLPVGTSRHGAQPACGPPAPGAHLLASVCLLTSAHHRCTPARCYLSVRIRLGRACCRVNCALHNRGASLHPSDFHQSTSPS